VPVSYGTIAWMVFGALVGVLMMLSGSNHN